MFKFLTPVCAAVSLFLMAAFSPSAAQPIPASHPPIDCTAFHQEPSGCWTIVHPFSIMLNGQQQFINMRDVGCFTEAQGFMYNNVNIISIVVKYCRSTP